MTQEDIVLQKVHEMLPNVPESFDLEDVRSKVELRARHETKGKGLLIDLEQMQVVLQTLRSTLIDLELALDGTIVMNYLLYNSMNSLYDGRIPTYWLKISWRACTMKDWFDQFKLRCEQYKKWYDKGQVDSFWLGGIFNPAGFLISFRQQTCRAAVPCGSWPLDAASKVR